MLVVKKDGSTVPPKHFLIGEIDENTNFTSLMAGIGNAVNLYCKDVRRINSLGVKAWNEFFANYRSGGGSPSFFEISPALVTTMNTVLNFVNKSEVLSICAPFLCESCEKESTRIVPVAEIPAFVKSELKMPCPHCGQVAVFDDLPHPYFSFMLR